MGGKTIGQKFFRIVAVLGLLTVIAAGGGGFALTQTGSDIVVSVAATDRREDVLIPLEEALNGIRLSVVQVQQFLSDVSATRGLDGLDDGFAKAEEQTRRFHAQVDALGRLAASDDELRTVILPQIPALQAAFADYHGSGTAMAKAYVLSGPAAGNAMMPDFDRRSEQLQTVLDEIATGVHAVGDASHDTQKALLQTLVADAALWRMVIAGLAVAAVIVAAFALVLSRKIGRRLAASVADINTVSQGQRVTIGIGDENDDIAEINRALLRFMEAEQRKKELEIEEQQRLSVERLRHERIQQATTTFDSAIVRLLDRMKTAVEHLLNSANTLSANAEQTQRQSAAVAAATDQANANVETVAAAGTELAASIGEISRQVVHSAETAQSATAEAADAIRKIAGLAESAAKIGEVVGLINDIASQTNLLALNATVEAARAGDAGKGFAVVAHEVKSLAGQTGRATSDIATQVTAVQSETQSAVAAIQGIATTIARISELSTAIAGAVDEQGVATTEIARNVEEASRGTHDVADNISGVAQAAAQTGQMAQTVFASASGLLTESETLEQVVKSFLDEVHAA
jgi:methyl-accepting chemotaxis protein